MAKMTNWNTAAFQAECVNVSMDRLEAAACIIRDKAKQILRSKITGPPITRPIPKGRHDIWLERTPGALIETIRVVRKYGDKTRNIWIMAGNYKTWWAKQIEFGRAGWKGGAKSFLRPALKRAPVTMKVVIENGQGETG